MPKIYTLGHSNHPFPVFNELLRKHELKRVVDIRSIPFSRTNPQFRKKELETALHKYGFIYNFLGRELGGKIDGPNFFDSQGQIDYKLVRDSSFFQRGIGILSKWISQGEIPVLVCAEKDPLKCHRFFLVAPALLEKGWEIRHILDTGEAITHQRAEENFLKDIPPSLFSSPRETLDRAYRWGGHDLL